MNDPAKPSLLERLSSMLLREPDDREQLVELLHSAFERRILDAEALSMIEGVLQVSETQVRDVMIPRSQMDMLDVAESPGKFIPFVIEKAPKTTVALGPRSNAVNPWTLAPRSTRTIRSRVQFRRKATMAQPQPIRPLARYDELNAKLAN